MAVSAISGYDFISGERISDAQRWINGILAIAAIIPASGQLASKLGWIEEGSKAFKAVEFISSHERAIMEVSGLLTGGIKYYETGDVWQSLILAGPALVSLAGRGMDYVKKGIIYLSVSTKVKI